MSHTPRTQRFWDKTRDVIGALFYWGLILLAAIWNYKDNRTISWGKLTEERHPPGRMY